MVLFYVIVSNDSDLAESLRLVKNQIKKLIGVVFPNTDHKRKPSRELTQYADFIKPIRQNLLRNSQLPDIIPGTEIYKPATCPLGGRGLLIRYCLLKPNKSLYIK